jgi:hypothetical protein
MVFLAMTAGAVVAGCTASSSSTTPSSAGTPAVVVPAAHRIPWKPLVSLAQLGQFRTRCEGRRFAVSFRASPDHATESVRLFVDGVQMRPRVLQPGDTTSTQLRLTRLQIWRVTQPTEPQTITAVVRIAPSRCPYGVPTTRVFYATQSFTSR